MSIFNIFSHILETVVKNNPTIESTICGAIGYGRMRKDGGHDHRTNRGPDRTPSQREGDKKRRKDD